MKFRVSNPLHLLVALLLVGLCAGSAEAQKSVSASPALDSAEELLYEAEFSRAILRNVDVADFRLTASQTPPFRPPSSSAAEVAGDYKLQFTGEAKSKGFFAKLFNLHFLERIVSTVNPVSFTVESTSKRDEQGKRVRTSEALFHEGKVIWTEKDPQDPSREPRMASAKFEGQVHDVLSAIYFLRTQRLTAGRSFLMTVSDSGRVYQVPVKVVERGRLKTVLGRVPVVRVDAELFGPNKMIGSEGQFSLWLTEDERHIPVRCKIKTEYGTFDIKLRKVIRNSTASQSRS